MPAAVVMPYSLRDELAKTLFELSGYDVVIKISSRSPGSTLRCTINYGSETANGVEYELYKLYEKINPKGGKVIVLD